MTFTRLVFTLFLSVFFSPVSADKAVQDDEYSINEAAYFLNSNPQNIYEHTLTTGWDLTTASYSGNSYATGMSSSEMRAFAMSKDGVWIYTTDGAAGSTLLHRHEMSTPFDITTATKDSTTINISTLIGVATKLNAQMAVSNNDAYLYVAYQGGGSDRQYRLELQTVFSGEFNIAIN